MPASTSACSEAADVLVLDRLVADVEHDAEVPAQRDVRLRDRDPGEPAPDCDARRAGVEVLLEVRDRLVRGLEEAVRLRLDREGHRAAGALLELDEMRGDPEHVLV